MAADRPPLHCTSNADFKQNEKLKKTDGIRKEKLNIRKLKDANMAGTAYSGDCTLILTQGYSAKAFAMSGLSVVGKDYYGVFPLHEIDEIQKIKKILGLQDGKVYEHVEELRYGHLIIMADEDYDGSCFKWLLISFLHSFWPSLLKVPNFMRSCIKPMLLVETFNKVLVFYTMPEYEAWRKKEKEYIIKYCKEMETVKSKRVREYFANLDHYIKDFVWVDDEDGDAIELSFSKKKTDQARMDWLRAPQDGTYIDSKEKRIRYRDFINKEFKQYLVAHLQRSIPSMVDGLKPVQRKILFYAFKKPIIQENEVFQFSHYVFEDYGYHEAIASLVGTIRGMGMAQSYVGSNNINLFQMGGTNIFTELSPITRYLFHKDDELLLNYLNDDGQSIEPAWFIPVIPMILVNGSEGTGVGWSSVIPKYNPRDIIANLKRLLYGEAMVPMHPGYTGNGYTTTESLEEIEDEYALFITKLPGGRWIWEYSEFLKAASQYGKPFNNAYMAHNDNTMTEDQMNTARVMHLFDANGEIKKYETPEQILEDFFHLRVDFYEKRRIALLRELKKAELLLENKVRYIDEVLKGNIGLVNRKADEIFAELKAKGFTYLPKETEPTIAGREEYGYLLSMHCASFLDDIEQLKKELDEKIKELDELKRSTSESLWLRDLEALDHQLEEKYPLEEHMAKINLKSSQDDDESSPEIAEEAPKKKAPAKRAAAGPQRASKKKQRCD